MVEWANAARTATSTVCRDASAADPSNGSSDTGNDCCQARTVLAQPSQRHENFATVKSPLACPAVERRTRQVSRAKVDTTRPASDSAHPIRGRVLPAGTISPSFNRLSKRASRSASTRSLSTSQRRVMISTAFAGPELSVSVSIRAATSERAKVWPAKSRRRACHLRRESARHPAPADRLARGGLPAGPQQSGEKTWRASCDERCTAWNQMQCGGRPFPAAQRVNSTRRAAGSARDGSHNGGTPQVESSGRWTPWRSLRDDQLW